MSHFWGSHDPYPRPRPRTLEERIAAGLLTAEEAAQAQLVLAGQPRHWTAWLRTTGTRTGVVVSPRFQGPGLVRNLQLIYQDAGGTPDDSWQMVDSDDNSGAGITVGVTLAQLPTGTPWFEMDIQSIDAVRPDIEAFAVPGALVNGVGPRVTLNHVVHRNQFFLKFVYFRVAVAVVSLAVEVELWEAVDLAQLAQLLD